MRVVTLSEIGVRDGNPSLWIIARMNETQR